jgi:uracil-DNA glycosylase family 4
MSLQDIKEAVQTCTKCTLRTCTKNPAAGEGPENGPVMVIGEALVGPAGALLDKMLDSIGLSRNNNTYIVNVLKCRPPENRDPKIEEIRACGDYLEEQIKIINPKFIITTGAFSTSYLLDKGFEQKVKITQHVGKIYKYKNIPFMPIFHPEYLLRNEDKKTIAWKNLKSIAKELIKLDIYSL